MFEKSKFNIQNTLKKSSTEIEKLKSKAEFSINSPRNIVRKGKHSMKQNATINFKINSNQNSLLKNFTIKKHFIKNDLIDIVKHYKDLKFNEKYEYIMLAFLFTHFTNSKKEKNENDTIYHESLHFEDKKVLKFCKMNGYEFLYSFKKQNFYYYAVNIFGIERHFKILYSK